jgi:hypothetical protein
MLVIWAAMLASVVALFAITKFMPMPESKDNTMVVLMLGIAALFEFALSFILKKRFLDQAIEKRDPVFVQTAMLVALAVCEAICLFGMFSFFVFASPYYYAFFALGGVGMLLHFPKRSHLHDVAYKR